MLKMEGKVCSPSSSQDQLKILGEENHQIEIVKPSSSPGPTYELISDELTGKITV